MKISKLIKGLEYLKIKHGDIVVISVDKEGQYEIEKDIQFVFPCDSTETNDPCQRITSVKLCGVFI